MDLPEDIRKSLEALYADMANLVEDEPPWDGTIEEWEHWAAKAMPLELYTLDEKKGKKKPVPEAISKVCSVREYKENVRFFYHKKKMAINQAVASALRELKKACNNDPKNEKKMSPKEITRGK